MELVATGTVVGFTAKRIKCEVNGFVANYSPKNVEAKGIKLHNGYYITNNVGFVCNSIYAMVKYFPTILSAVFKLSVIAIALIFVCIAVSVYISDWTWSANYV